VKKTGFIFLAYILVFSIVGVGILQYVFIKNQSTLLQKQIIFAVKGTLNEIEWEIKKNEIESTYKEMDSILKVTNKQLKKELSINKELVDNCPDDNSYVHINHNQSGSNINWESTNEQRINNSSGFLKNSANRKLLLEYYYNYLNRTLKSVPLNDRFKAEDLQKIISGVFKRKGIDIPFEFAIYHNGSLTSVKSENYSGAGKFIYITHPLFDDIMNNDKIHLTIAVPKKEAYKNNLWLFQILSYLFTGFLLISFLITIFSLMRQKHIARLKNDFINNITHEFKTPIATISLVIDSIKSPSVINDPEKIKHYLNILKKENQRMLNQVEKILFLSKLEQGKIIWENKIINIHDVINDAIRRMKLIFESTGAKIHLRLNADNPYVKADPTFILDALTNLLDNAVKYSKDHVDITIETGNIKNNLYIKIKDKGVGMSKEVMAHVFEKFYRKPTGNVHNVPGHGIGLTFVKQVVSNLNGDIYVESEPGKGTTFTIYLPVVNKPDAEKFINPPKKKHNNNNQK
jgi:signal transduction histidine kinase